MPYIITCSSVRPTCPMGGWEKTAAGTALSKEEVIKDHLIEQ
jgi:hypothetical protein